MRVKNLITQFLRYAIVGGIAFISDSLTLTITYKIFLKNSSYKLLIGVATGFIVGTIVNYFLSKRFVFSNETSRTKSILFDFFMYIMIGLLGLLITEGGMYIGTEMATCNYAIIKVFVAGIVLLWNYLARCFLVYKRGVGA